MNNSATSLASQNIWAAIPTPFQAPNLELDEQGLRHNVRRYISVGLRGVFCNGLMGEVWALTNQERRRVVEVLVDEAAGRLGVSAVITASSLQETCELGLHAKKAGAEHAVLLAPTSGPRSDEQLIAYFRHIANYVDMPMVIFNSATAAGSPLTPTVFKELCEIPQLRLLKSTAYETNVALRDAACNGVIVSDPLEEHFFDSYVKYQQRVLYADPEPYLYQGPGNTPINSYIEMLDKGAVAEASIEFEKLSLHRAAFNKWVMDPLKTGHMPCAALKYWCDLIGLVGGPVRRPLAELTESQRHELKNDLISCSMPGLDLIETA
ncbi:dihydrodipicolinate synthase family protein [Herbaspirillum robiniae]|uniref:dihydrodipicolinate synthase family protein n=1 Tax=Herbaspirillum robiniae TaxID=2014887 RepID=UPI003D78089F